MLKNETEKSNMNETTQSIIRSVLKIGAGALLAKGVIEAGAAETIVSSLMGIISVVWGIIAARKATANKV
jgi:hypothetical protein